MGWREALDSYLAELTERGRRPYTVRGYRSDLSGFVDHLEMAGSRLDLGVVTSYLSLLNGLAPATRARKRSALRGFLDWAHDHALTADPLADNVAVSRPPPPSGSPPPARADVEAVLAKIPLKADQDQLFFGLLARLGLRPGEALALCIEDFDEQAETLNVPGRGGVRRQVLVDDSQLLLRLVNWRLTTGRTSGPLFCAPGRTSPLRYQSMAARWARYCSAAGVSMRLGDLRRAHAAELLAGGVPEWVVRDRLGQHSGPLTPVATERGGADEAIRAWHASQNRSTREHTGRQNHTRRPGVG